MTRRQVEIESLAQFDRHIVRTDRLSGWFIRAIDLSERRPQLRRVDPHGAVFLGCQFAPGVAVELIRDGALVFPELGDLPFQPYRSSLYTAEELYADGSYADSPDAAVYAWSRMAARKHGLTDALAIALHDHAISDAIDDLTERVRPTDLVGVMGGHRVLRIEAAYRQAAELGRTLAAGGRLVVTGGGPGAMEAANLGAYLSAWPDGLDPALDMLGAAPTYRTSIERWLTAARTVCDRWPASRAGRSLSIPTWFYGHEPTNVFATRIAKYFTNALREDTMLHRCRGGIVYLPGAAGTVQEIFQAATENYYAADDSLIAPLVLVGRDYWTRTLPAWPLLDSLSSGRSMAAAVYLVDNAADAASLLLK